MEKRNLGKNKTDFIRPNMTVCTNSRLCLFGCVCICVFSRLLFYTITWTSVLSTSAWKFVILANWLFLRNIDMHRHCLTKMQTTKKNCPTENRIIFPAVFRWHWSLGYHDSSTAGYRWGVYLDWGVGVGGAGGEGAVLAMGIESGGRGGGELRDVLS